MTFTFSRRQRTAAPDTPLAPQAPRGENPYLNARREWNSHTGSIVTSRQMWQIVGILSLLCVLAAIGGLIHIGSQSKFIPYVVEKDKLGNLSSPVVLERAGNVDPRVIEATVRTFIEDARMVTPDVALQRKAIFRVFAHLNPGDAATGKMNDWYSASPLTSPFKRAETSSVAVEIVSTLPQTPTTWQVDWNETTRDLAGVSKAQPIRMRALVTVYTVPLAAGKQPPELNGLLIYVRDFSWSKQQ